jgi:hypothetical protein
MRKSIKSMCSFICFIALHWSSQFKEKEKKGLGKNGVQRPRKQPKVDLFVKKQSVMDEVAAARQCFFAALPPTKPPRSQTAPATSRAEGHAPLSSDGGASDLSVSR